ncbi:MAG: hypothetical protein HYX35_01400 [Proteobacteria bacterium]|nr:hypothetical protein [Pseudomonadota bacterium]
MTQRSTYIFIKQSIAFVALSLCFSQTLWGLDITISNAAKEGSIGCAISGYPEGSENSETCSTYYTIEPGKSNTANVSDRCDSITNFAVICTYDGAPSQKISPQNVKKDFSSADLGKTMEFNAGVDLKIE